MLLSEPLSTRMIDARTEAMSVFDQPCVLRVHEGQQPSSCDTLAVDPLVELDMEYGLRKSGAPGVLRGASPGKGTVLRSGIPGWWRLYLWIDIGLADGVFPRLQGSAEELNVYDRKLYKDGEFMLSSFSVTLGT